mmetsp:Transcript_3660/g.6742  ORF Transcript_3660/g.6742 Transcript_3660/m.6742 type:complete len:254 (+) Transcript_3660:212-973(+)
MIRPRAAPMMASPASVSRPDISKAMTNIWKPATGNNSCPSDTRNPSATRPRRRSASRKRSPRREMSGRPRRISTSPMRVRRMRSGASSLIASRRSGSCSLSLVSVCNSTARSASAPSAVAQFTGFNGVGESSSNSSVWRSTTMASISAIKPLARLNASLARRLGACASRNASARVARRAAMVSGSVSPSSGAAPKASIWLLIVAIRSSLRASASRNRARHSDNSARRASSIEVEATEPSISASALVAASSHAS